MDGAGISALGPRVGLSGLPDPMGDATAQLEARRRQQVQGAGYDPDKGLYDRYSEMLGVLGPTIAERARAAADAMRRGDMATYQKIATDLSMDFGGFLGSIKGVKNPIRAYHGSPHDFDKFDMSKIGNGEGAQAYGHGLYFAENEGVARSYRDALKYRALVDPSASPLDPRRIAGELYESWQGDIAGALDDARHYDNAKSIISELRKIGANPPAGRMYEVNIHADPERFLDWDKPLSGQTPTVRDIAERVKQTNFISRRKLESPDATGRTAWESLRSPFPAKALGYKNWSTKGPAEYLNDQGIPGIKYLDQGSRAAGDGSRNYVVFDDKLIEILRKYGIMAPVAGAGIGSLYMGDEEGM